MMNKTIYPPKLKRGDKAIIISPSGNVDIQYINGASKVLQNWGLLVEVATYADRQYGRFAGTVDQRGADLQEAMDDPNVKLIFCSRGGYGVVHLLDKLNFEGIRQYPKWIVGYSDITALHLALLQEGIVSLHAPMARHLTEDSLDIASVYLKDALFINMPDYFLASHSLNRKGLVTGKLFGGNLAVLSGLIGTPYMEVPENGILFIEDIAESPYKIDRMMWQLKLSGILGRISALVIGQFTDCLEDPLMGSTIYESIRDIVKEYNYPLVFDFPVGHVKENYTLLHGGLVEIEVRENKVKMKSSK